MGKRLIEILRKRFQWISKNPLIVGIMILVIGWIGIGIYDELILPKIQEYKERSHIRNIAFLIYPEVLGNVNKIKACIAEIDNGKKIELKEIKFSIALYATHYKVGIFGGGELDKQLANFYNNLNSIDIYFKKVDFERIKAQGESVSQLLSENYGCQDYDKIYSFNGENETIAVSSDTVTFTDTHRAASGVVVIIDSNKKD